MQHSRTLITLALLLVVFTPATVTQAAPPTIGGCQVFPADNPWNTDISNTTTYPVHPKNTQYMNSIAGHGGDFVHPDFGSPAIYGIPYTLITSTQPKVPVTFDYDDDSDVGPYPIPPNALIEGTNASDGDRHVLVIDTDNCVLYETWDSHYVGGAQHAWHAGSGAIFNLNSNALRPDGWTSADAAGLPIFPGLARCDEANTGTVDHAFRFTVAHTQSAYVYPATHEASNDTNVNEPPMGLRFRMKASYSETGFTGQSLAIVKALKKYGMILADNGSNWYISGTSDPCWDDEELNQLKDIPATAFEAIVSPPPPATDDIVPPTLYSPADGAGITGTPVLDWNTVAGAEHYEIQFNQGDTPTTTVTTTDREDYTQYTPLVNMLPGFTYSWRVRAIDDDTSTTTAWSNPHTFMIASGVNAAPIRNFYVGGTPTLTWNRVAGATHYHVQVSDKTNFSHVVAEGNLISSPQLYYQVSPALTDGIYYWRVQSQNGAGAWSGWSVMETFMVDA